MRKILTVSSFLLLVFPVVAGAQGMKGTPVEGILFTISDIIDYLIYIFMALATAVFLWGIVKYIAAAADEKQKEAAKGVIKNGIIGLFLAVSIWGIVRILETTFLGSSGSGQGIPLGPGGKDPR